MSPKRTSSTAIRDTEYGNRLPFVSVVIPVYNDWERLETCLAALAKQSYPADQFEVIVVDNGSRRAVSCELQERFPSVLFCLEATPGSYAARNCGIELAQGEVIAFTDSDCRPAVDWLASGVAALFSFPECGMVAGRVELVFKNPSRPTAADLYEQVLGFPQEEYLTNSQFGATANVFTRREVIRQVGPFNAGLKSGGDAEWGQRVFAAGYQQAYAAEAIVLHPSRGSLWELVKKRRRTAGGLFQIKREKEAATGRWPRTVLRVIKKHVIPPMSEFHALWQNERLTATTDRMKVVCVRFLLNYVHAFEFARLGLGGTVRR